MYGQFLLFETGATVEPAKRVFIGETFDRDEAWLRDTILQHPEIIPITDLDPAFGELVPICRELRTPVGVIDAVFMNRHGRLTIVECKLWKNPEARRKVVAQALDYVAAHSRWSYADFQRQTSVATGEQGNIPFRKISDFHGGTLNEQVFIDAASRSLKEGRFLVLIAGDGIREDARALTDLVGRNSTKAFSLAMLEIALFQFMDKRLLVQPRIIVETELIERTFVTVTPGKQGDVLIADEDIGMPIDSNLEDDENRRSRVHLRDWWKPVLEMKFDDPEQEPPYWVVTNNVVLNMPFPGIVLKSWSTRTGQTSGVFLGQTRKGALDTIAKFIRRDRKEIANSLPSQTQIDSGDSYILLRNDDLQTDAERYDWIKTHLNLFVNVLRPKMKQWDRELSN